MTNLNISVRRERTHSFRETVQVFCLQPAEDVEGVDEGCDQHQVGNNEGGQDMALTRDGVVAAIVTVVLYPV